MGCHLALASMPATPPGLQGGGAPLSVVVADRPTCVPAAPAGRRTTTAFRIRCRFMQASCTYACAWQVRGTIQRLGTAHKRRRLCVPKLAPLRRLLLFLSSLAYTVAAMMTTGVPILDDLWRWVTLILITLPLLLVAAALTGHASPVACACFVILQVLFTAVQV